LLPHRLSLFAAATAFMRRTLTASDLAVRVLAFLVMCFEIQIGRPAGPLLSAAGLCLWE